MTFADIFAPISSGFTGIGDALAQETKDLYQTFQNTVMPNTKPANTNTFSFDFAGGFNKAIQALTSPFVKATDPVKGAGQQIVGTLGDVASALLKAGGNKAIEMINNSNKKTEGSINVSNTATNPMPSQSALGAFMSLFGGGSTVASGTPNVDYVAQSAAQNSMNSVLLIGGIGLILVFMTLAKGK